MPRRLPVLLVLWCALVVLPGVLATVVFDVDIYSEIHGWVIGVWILGFLAQLGVFMAVSQTAGRNNVVGWLIASIAPFLSDFGAPASIVGPVLAAVLAGAFACWLYWSCTRQADVIEHGVPAVGEVLEVKKPIMNVVINNVYIRRTLLLRISRSDGTPPYEAKWAGTFMLGEIPSRGDRFTLRVDPHDPRRFETVDSTTSSAPPPVSSSVSPDHGVVDALQKLTDLHRAGQLTDAEFSEAKGRLLGS